MQTLMPGQTMYFEYGPSADRITLVVRVDMHHNGVSITVVEPTRTTLDRAFTDLEQGRAYLTYLRDSAKAGQPAWLIEAGAGALTSTTAIVDDAEQALIDAINTDLDADVADRVAENNQLMADRDTILNGDSWYAERQAARRQAALRNTSTRAHLKPPTPTELARMRAHQDGIVTTAPGQPWTLLQAIVRRGLAVEHEVYGRHVLKSVRLNQRGMAVADDRGEAAA